MAPPWGEIVVARSTTKVLKAATLLGFVPSLLVALAVFWPGADLVSPRGYYVGQDFVNFWTAGHLALDGRLAAIYEVDPYGHDAYNDAVRALFPPARGILNFSYPPHVLPLLAGLAMLPYGLALAVWLAAGLAAFVAVAFSAASRAMLRDLLPYVLVSPVVLLVVTVGQASFWLAALFVSALAALPRRPGIAGVLLGLMTVKPQLGLLLPPALLLLGERRAFLAAAVTATLLVASSIVLFGLAPWHDYLVRTLPFQGQILTRMIGIYPAMMVTPYAAFWWLGVPAGAALGLHAVIAAGVAAVALTTLRSRADTGLKIAILALASLLVTPYCLNYDFAIPAAALVLWVTREDVTLRPATLAALGLFWAMAYVGMAAALWGVPILPLAALALLLALAREARQRPAPLAAASIAVAGA